MDHCVKCERQIHEFTTGRKLIEGKVYCDDCFFDEAGRAIEENPIGFPHRRVHAH